MVLTARAENHIRGVDDLDDTIARLVAYREAGADALYAPGLTDLDQIASVVAAVELPLNVLVLPGGPTVAELAECRRPPRLDGEPARRAGVRRPGRGRDHAARRTEQRRPRTATSRARRSAPLSLDAGVGRERLVPAALVAALRPGRGDDSHVPFGRRLSSASYWSPRIESSRSPSSTSVAVAAEPSPRTVASTTG